jgi:hypothetical protein
MGDKTSINDITGDKIQTKAKQPSKFDQGYEGIDWSVKLVPETTKTNKNKKEDK